MSSSKTKKKQMLDDKIEQFCQGSAQLLSNIHDRCGDMASPKKKKRGRKKKEVLEIPDEEFDIAVGME